MAKPFDFSAILNRCPEIEAKSLEAFLNGLLDTDLETLAQLPGSPGHVLCAQFTYYARSSVTLREPLCRSRERFQALEDALERIQTGTKQLKKRKPSHGNPSSTQASGGS